MTQLINKNHIKLLAERFDHAVAYGINKIFISNYLNKIEIESEGKEIIKLSYNNVNINSEILEFEKKYIYDVLIKLFRRHELYKIEFNPSDLIQLNDFKTEENIAKKTIQELKNKLKHSEVDKFDLGGNRFEVEYYKGILILRDDLPGCKSANVIDLDIREL
jgi:hypothetical protein